MVGNADKAHQQWISCEAEGKTQASSTLSEAMKGPNPHDLAKEAEEDASKWRGKMKGFPRPSVVLVGREQRTWQSAVLAYGADTYEESAEDKYHGHLQFSTGARIPVIQMTVRAL